MKRFFLIFLAIIVILLQISLLPALRPFGVVPNLALIFVVLVGLEGTASVALGVAVAAGFTMDLASGTNFGLWTGLFVLLALVTGFLHRAGLELGGHLISFVLIAAGTLAASVLILLGLVNTASNLSAGIFLTHLSFELMLNLGLTLALRPLLRWVSAGARAGVRAI